MDKKNTTIGVLLLVAAFAVLFLAPRSAPPALPSSAPPDSASSQGSAPASTSSTASAAAGQPVTPGASAPTPAALNSIYASINRDSANATVTTLANEFVEVRLTDFGGAVREVAFKRYPAVQGRPEPYLFNLLHEDPILALGDFPGLGRATRYDLVSHSPTEVVYRTVLDGRIEVTRTYRLQAATDPAADPYRLRHETTFRNLSGMTVPLPRAALSLGTATLVNSSDPGQYLTIASYDGDKAAYTDRGDLQGGGFMAMFGSGREPKTVLEKPGQVVWAAAKNQFFASIFTPEKPAIAVITRRIELPAFPDSQNQNIGLTGAMRFDLPALAPNGSAKLGGLLYVGPKEYSRLAKFEHNEDRVMQFDRYFFNRIFLSGYVAPFLNTLLNATHRWVGNWGLAVIVMTLILKTVSVPFTLAASRSAKRMAKLQPAMQVIREKYKDNPQKQQAATLELFKEHKVNPVGGCIPVLITMPLFVGFFAMIQSPAELRFAPFLWAKDLAAPDTVGHILGLPINIMPLLMGATMYFQMQLTPQPSVDNAQAKMMKFMPFVFTLFCYSFSCALSLYSTINGLFTIGQQMVINRTKDPADAPPTAAPVPGGKPIKNVTPTNKKLK